jgi:CheY-like chemotaxis protein
MGKRILVADDSLTIQKAFAMVLSGQDYTLVFARSVDEALAAAKAGRPDLVYADSVMGGGSGYDLCASIKADPGLRGIPVHILTSNQNPYDEVRALRAGADGQFIKPFDSQSLLDGVSAALVAPLAAPAPVRVGPGPVVSAATRPAPAAPRAPVEHGNTTEEIEPSDEAADQAADDDNYGEFTIERSSAPTPAATWSARPPTWPGANARTATPSPPAAVPPSRPSLIPGVSPPAPAVPVRPGPALPGVIPAPPPTSPPRTAAPRTIMGFPAAGGSQTSPPATAASAAPPLPAKPIVPRPSSPVPAPVMPRPTPPPPTAVSSGAMPVAAPPMRKTGSVSIPIPQSMPAPVVAAVSSAIDQKMAAIATRGKEYEAIAKLSREIIEQVVWEVVPELAEAIIKQEIDRLVAAKR